MKTQNTSTSRLPKFLGKPFHESQRTAISTNVDASGKAQRTLQTSTLEMTWTAQGLVIQGRVSQLKMAGR